MTTYFKNFELLLEYFNNNNKHLIITGDLNSRVGILDEITTRFNYIANPDTNVNLNGKNLLGICSADFNFVMRNGFSNDIKTFDSKFTFYWGNVRSEVDFAISNKVDDINSFIIMDKYIYSDHCPITISCSSLVRPPMNTVRECSERLFSYTHMMSIEE